MAEFQEVIRQIARYCNAQKGCASCKLSKITDDNCPSDLFADDNGAMIENEVMSWSAENPEPVYPSIAKYLERFGITIRRDGSLQADFFKANEHKSSPAAEFLASIMRCEDCEYPCIARENSSQANCERHMEKLLKENKIAIRVVWYKDVEIKPKE